MTPGRVQARVIADRAGWARRMVAAIRELPLDLPDEFMDDHRNIAAAESYLRRGLEAVFDLGRHVLAKGFGRASGEYRAIADGLVDVGILTEETGATLRQMAGYRNRMVHFYNRVQEDELLDICRNHLADLESVIDAILAWVDAHPDRVDPGRER